MGDREETMDAVVLDGLSRVGIPQVVDEVRGLIGCREADKPVLCVAILNGDAAHDQEELAHRISGACPSVRPEAVVTSRYTISTPFPGVFALKRLLDSERVSTFVVLTVKENVSSLIVALDAIFTSAYSVKAKLYSGDYVNVPALLKDTMESVRSAMEEECSHFLTTFQAVPGEKVEVIRSESICDKTFFHGFSTRKGGCSSFPPVASLNLLFRAAKRDSPLVVKENRRRLLDAVGAPPTHRLLLPKVGHSSCVWVTTDPEPAEYDAIVSNQPGLAIAAPAADCVTVVLGDARRSVFAAVHSGWKGTVGNIVGAAVEAMTGRMGCNPQDITAAIGPSIGVCCYDVGNDVEDLFRKDPILAKCVTAVEGKSKRHLDLQMAVGLQLEEAGVPPSHIDRTPSKLCTYCNKDRLFSYRRDGVPFGTLVGFIGLH